MKNLNLIRRTTLRSLVVAAIATFTVFSVSCSKEEMIAPETSQGQIEGLKSANRAPAKGDMSIAEIAIDAEFNELVSALSYVDAELDAGLVDLFMNGKDQYTVFAPTDDAFFALYDAFGVDMISDLPADIVLKVLFYHVVEGRRAANSVVPKKNSKMIETLLGQTFAVNADLSIDAFGNSANIAAANISASNGIIHVIDAVIIPDVSE